jgi:pimeloyl-ACP methyl ester carboxylesterase
MRASTCLPALVLAVCQTTNAMNNAFARSFNLLADMGLNPDGTPIDTPSFDGPSFNDADVRIAGVVDGSEQPPPENISAEYVSLPIDNFAHNNKSGTFNNRYWAASSSYKPGGPVFIYDVGEADASTSALFRIQNSTSFFKQIVDKYNGIGIVWEHRFYGNSSPGGPVNINTPAENFRFLNTEQSLADVAAFASQFSLKNRGLNYTLTPEKTPWVFVGGSYPGMRAAFMREKYPDTIYASYASSAPVQASVDQSFYFEPVWRGMQRYGFGNCSRDIQAATRYIDGVFDSKDRAAADQLKIMFLGKGAEKNSHATFADALTTIFATWQSYGVESGNTGLRKLCDWIETGTNTSSTQGANQKKIPQSVQRWASYPYFAVNVNTYLETNCSGKVDVVGDCDLDRKFTDPAMISWTWQYCTQWGKFICITSFYRFLHNTSIEMLIGHSSQVSSSPQISDPANSFQNTTLSCTRKTSVTANSLMRRAISSPNGLPLIRRIASSAAGLSGRPTPTGPMANSILGVHYHQRARSLLRQRS